MGIDAEALIAKMPRLPENVYDLAQTQQYLQKLAEDAQDLLTGEECVAALKVNQMMADRLEAALRNR
jgi:hypothetical protein